MKLDTTKKKLLGGKEYDSYFYLNIGSMLNRRL